ncbi:unnamed protein product [Didymodactylos carnosus]|uniref:Uncharacterized protein n=1 Tax=Didymodactylos carnosus TaxID=1234261 RepID=A0A814THH7_9BILA|nr:unnamed protein product [Didymodactylos carnosus]CAF1161462.1 unnamed protein product [Didymodactylos carnosus]CAF3796024.1 unnamed protein product [Didymodactylos carnosus]CAF3925064.1 unnamed protein product [Didymodactylos carnosus]
MLSQLTDKTYNLRRLTLTVERFSLLCRLFDCLPLIEHVNIEQQFPYVCDNDERTILSSYNYHNLVRLISFELIINCQSFDYTLFHTIITDMKYLTSLSFDYGIYESDINGYQLQSTLSSLINLSQLNFRLIIRNYLDNDEHLYSSFQTDYWHSLNICCHFDFVDQKYYIYTRPWTPTMTFAMTYETTLNMIPNDFGRVRKYNQMRGSTAVVFKYFPNLYELFINENALLGDMHFRLNMKYLKSLWFTGLSSTSSTEIIISHLRWILLRAPNLKILNVDFDYLVNCLNVDHHSYQIITLHLIGCRFDVAEKFTLIQPCFPVLEILSLKSSRLQPIDDVTKSLTYQTIRKCFLEFDQLISIKYSDKFDGSITNSYDSIINSYDSITNSYDSITNNDEVLSFLYNNLINDYKNVQLNLSGDRLSVWRY